MLKTADSALTQQQQPATKTTKDTHGKNTGNTKNLLKATSKVLAFLNPTSRKTHASHATTDYYRQEEKIPHCAAAETQTPLFLPQANNTNNVAIRRGDILGDSNAVDQYKHLFQNRPLNNQQLQQSQPPVSLQENLVESNDNSSTNTINYTHSRTNSRKHRPASRSTNSRPHNHTQTQIRHSNSSSSMVSLYTEHEKQLAKEQLRIVRRSLRTCSPDSAYFRRFAAMADHWRNFLPRRRLGGARATKAMRQKQKGPQDGPNAFYDSRSDAEVDSDEVYEYEHSLDGSEEEEEEDDDDEEIASSAVRVVRAPVPSPKEPSSAIARRRLVNSSSTSSFVKELLREEELGRLVSSASLSHLAERERERARERERERISCSSSSASGWIKDYGSLLDDDKGYDAMFYQDRKRNIFKRSRSGVVSTHDADADDTEDANYADADENSADGAFYSHPAGLSRSSRATKNGHGGQGDVKGKKFHQRSSKMVLAEVWAQGLSRSVQQHHQKGDSSNSGNRARGHRVRPNDIRRLGVTHGANEKRSYRRRRSTGKYGHNYPSQHEQHQQQQAHFGGVRLEDVVRGIETEFSLSLDTYNDKEEESEDSLTYLMSGCEDSGNDDAEEDFLEENNDKYYPYSTTLSVSSPQSGVESVSPESTLLNSSDCGEDPANSPEAEQLLREEPPEYKLHKQDQKISPPFYQGSMSIQDQQAIKSASAAALAEAMGPIQKQNEEQQVQQAQMDSHKTAAPKNANNNNHARPSLTLQTMTIGGIAPGALSAFESRPLGSQFSLTKCNSTSSLYIDSTMAKSDVDETLRAVATVLYDKVLESHRTNDCRTERIINSSSYVPSEKVVMTQADIFDFMRFIFDCGQNLGAENAIITLIYVERLTELGNLSFHAINWRRLLLGALILSIKVWEDLAVFNSDVCAIFEGLSVKDVNALERFSMAKLQYNVSVKRSIYAAYYFRLRDVSEQRHNEHYGRLTLSMSQREGQGSCDDNSGSSSQIMTMRNDSFASFASCTSQPGLGSSRAGSSGGLTGMGIGIGMVGSNSSCLPGTHHSKVPVGPGYRKWTLKPLSVREADRLEARSSLYSSTMMMEVQERRDAGCCLDEYSSATPEELHSLSATLLTSSMHTISSMASVSTAATTSTTGSKESQSSDGEKKGMSASSSASSVLDGELAGKEDRESERQAARRTLRLKKSRSDFFFQNTTPASIM
ncbi:hypothetical protein BGZ58_008160 [Dissophora ornata]|nr:hypothetical protein BGZ58_008160 [Dissophora ornata]